MHITKYLPFLVNLGLTKRYILYAIGAVNPLTLLQKPPNVYKRAEFLGNFRKHHPLSLQLP